MEKSHEFSRRALSLSLAIYRVTARIPEGEVLAGQARELSNEIAGDLATGELVAVDKKIARLQIYLKIAQAQNWVAPINWSTLDFEYYKLKHEVSFALSDKEVVEKLEAPDIVSHNTKRRGKPAIVHGSQPDQLSDRQKKVLQIIQDKGSAKMSDLLPLLKNVASERTLRNDLQNLVNGGLIKKQGLKKSVRYFRV